MTEQLAGVELKAYLTLEQLRELVGPVTGMDAVGSGKGNFKALFEAIEREQERRGNL